jgi:hypothetical protein
MKKCGECGWPNNADGASDCEKCGASLSGGSSASVPPPSPQAGSSDAKKTMMGGGQQLPDTSQAKKTVMGSGQQMPSWDASGGGASASNTSSQASGDLTCGKCGFYPLRAPVAAASPCPNCGFAGGPGQAAQPAQGGGISKADMKKTLAFSEVFFEAPEKTPKFTLLENDRVERPFEGKEVSVGRENIDANNFSISGQHALFEHIDGKWVVSNQSSNGVTLVQVKGKAEIQDGDLILIGNKLFRFKTE